MAYVNNMPDEEENKNPAQGAVPPSGGGVQLSPSSGVGSVGGPGGAPGAAPKGGGQFATLDKYISANQGQAQPLAGKITTGIGNEYSNLEGQNTSTLNNINGQVNAGKAPGNANDVLAQESANPVSFAGNEGNVKNFQSLLNASYAGPASAETVPGFSNQQNAINKAIATGKQQTTTEGGREQLLSKYEGAPSTSVTGLNSAILSHSPEALGQVENAYKPFQNLLTGLSTGAEGINTNITSAKNEAAATNKAANEAISSQITDLNKNVGTQLTTAQQNATKSIDALKANLATGKLTDADLKTLGMTADQWNSLTAAQKAAATSEVVMADARNQFGTNTGTVNIDLSNFLTTQDPNLAYTAANTATPEQYQKAQAFQSLLKGLNTGAPALALNPTDASKAGTAPTNLNSFDYQTATNTAQQAKAEEMASAKAYADALQGGADEEHAQLAAQKAQKIQMGVGAATILAPGLAIPAAAGANYGLGAYNSAKDVISRPTLKNVGQFLNTTMGPAGAANMAKGAGAAITNAVKTVTNIFCFHPDTLINMVDGTTMPIHKIQVGDTVKGGLVIATTRAIGHDFHWYRGVLVTGKHAVHENGKWLRVEDSKLGKHLPKYVEVVHSLVTSDHRIWVGDIEFADQHENDNYENLNLEQSLAELNKNV
jgi:hypothetical protein